MSNKGVSKHCSILNYIRRTDESLYDIIQDLCLGRMFIPKRGAPGITFLYPDDNLVKEIKTIAYGDEPEKAIEILQSLVLLDDLQTIKDFSAKQSDIPTFLRKKLPIEKVDANKVVLKNGAEFELDSKFKARSDRSNLAVYKLSKQLVPVTGEAADFSNVKQKVGKKGGADLMAGSEQADRKLLFEAVLDDYTKSNCDPAMELIVAMYNWTKAETSGVDAVEREKIANLIESQVSYDSLASLAIILQPYKTKDDRYIANGTYSIMVKEIMSSSGDEDFKKLPSYTIDKNAHSKYSELAESCKYTDVYECVKQCVKDSNPETATRITVGNHIVNVTEMIVNKLHESTGTKNKLHLCELRNDSSKLDIIAEAELRVVSATLQDYLGYNGEDPSHSLAELKNLFSGHNLDGPYLCADKSNNALPVSYFHSVTNMILKTDVLLYVPGLNGNAITNRTQFGDDMDLSYNISLKSLNYKRRCNSQARIANPNRPVY